SCSNAAIFIAASICFERLEVIIDVLGFGQNSTRLWCIPCFICRRVLSHPNTPRGHSHLSVQNRPFLLPYPSSEYPHWESPGRRCTRRWQFRADPGRNAARPCSSFCGCPRCVG